MCRVPETPGTTDPAPAAEFDASAFAELERLRALVRYTVGGPYRLGRWTDEVVHDDPCDCDEDNESVGERCITKSDWSYAVFVDTGSFDRLYRTLPLRPTFDDEEADRA